MYKGYFTYFPDHPWMISVHESLVGCLLRATEPDFYDPYRFQNLV